MRKFINKAFIISAIIVSLAMVSCKKYLNNAPEAIITENDAFSNWNAFQGFVEEMYLMEVSYGACYWNTQGWKADENVSTVAVAFEDGNYWNNSDLFTGSFDLSLAPRNKRIWPCAWYGIRRANQALSKLDLLIDATQEQKDLIKGQALFFRGWFYFELMRYWGGMPYIDKVLSPTEEMNYPRLNYRETALKAAKDFQDAAALLPVTWDGTATGNITIGANRQRINKIYALSYLGKDLLYAASPMMNEASTGNNAFDPELCKKAANAFAQVIDICNKTGVYKLQPWSSITDVFYLYSSGSSILPGGTEVILAPLPTPGQSGWNEEYQIATTPAGLNVSTQAVFVPANNYVKNYAMANGLPIDDPASGYNPNDPWTGREARFYKDITIDGDKLSINTSAGLDMNAQLYIGGRHRTGGTPSVSGYFLKKWYPFGWGKYYTPGAGNVLALDPYLRLADVYLMYAEALLQGYGSSQSSDPGLASLTAEGALNVVRNRAQLPSISAAYTATKDKFMGEIIRERAVELGWENSHRFCDLRRWNLNGDARYLKKTAIDFDRDPVTKKPINIKERVVVERVVTKRNNWLPIEVKYTTLYKEFPQNPGW
ncbi:MAG: RagB/SusD family nutrient uptake outer membrane protein [Prolixibacteraceae bacterium]|jgi:hypothetical protein|nr:RagB/SusD family nutrient uptake outer membrane protein [Prolixibacteraceae bacterium]